MVPIAAELPKSSSCSAFSGLTPVRNQCLEHAIFVWAWTRAARVQRHIRNEIYANSIVRQCRIQLVLHSDLY